MKNEADTTATKHKNEDFFKELDKDRKEKKCEYAVLVSLLEIDNDYYNNSDNEGHIYVSLQNEGDKEYVIREGTAYCQGIFLKYFTCGDKVEEIRNGGIGSTDKEME